MQALRNANPTGLRVSLFVALLAVGAATLLIYLLEIGLSIRNASSVYLLAVAAVAIGRGTVAAIATAFGAFFAYNFLFIDPRYSLAVRRPEEVVTLVLLLFVGVVIGRLAGLQRDRERQALSREREARALFGISREVATAERLTDAMQYAVQRLRDEAAVERVWIGLGPMASRERVVADSGGPDAPPQPGTHSVLRRDHEEGAAAWARIHPPAPGARSSRADDGGRRSIYRVEIRAGDDPLGSLWIQRTASATSPDLEETRLLAVTADQVGQALRRERLAVQAAELEITRRSDELKSALLDSVSHDLRTPLASIRAAAGSLADPAIELSADERRAAARAIDDEAERLNQLVGNLLDMSRIQAGALVADIDLMPLAELLESTIDRLRPALAGYRMTVDIPSELPSVRIDATFLDQVVSNLFENAVKYAPAGSVIRVHAASGPDRRTVDLVIEDSGPGVADEAIAHLFDRFYRVPQPREGPRHGFGLGLAVAHGLVAAMGGHIRAGRSELGGLAVTVSLPAEPMGRSEAELPVASGPQAHS
jgi:two-component system sensor histidine kinase KdpD